MWSYYKIEFLFPMEYDLNASCLEDGEDKFSVQSSDLQKEYIELMRVNENQHKNRVSFRLK